MSDSKRILITGAGSGFGRDAALILAADGYDVIAAVRDEQQYDDLTREVCKRGVSVRVAVLDLLSEADRAAAFPIGMPGRTALRWITDLPD